MQDRYALRLTCIKKVNAFDIHEIHFFQIQSDSRSTTFDLGLDLLFGLLAGDRDLRGFGSQGEQRLTVLALLLAEARLLATRRGIPPLLLLDDVLSELDTSRRTVLSGLVGDAGQTVVTATHR